MKKLRKTLTILIAAGMLSSASRSFSASSGPTFESGETPTTLLEVFSSEGCSSCPPAEKWLTSLKKSPALWRDFIPVCFHVDYWDHLGWKDILGSRRFTDRQRTYERLSRTESVYTPGFMVNGREWKGFFNGTELPARSNERVGKLKAVVSRPLQVEIEFSPADPSVQSWRVEAAILGMEIISPIGAGENRGETLQHDFAVLSHKTQNLTRTPKGFTTTLNLLGPSMPATRYAIAVWVTRGDDPMPVQSAGGEVKFDLIR